MPEHRRVTVRRAGEEPVSDLRAVAVPVVLQAGDARAEGVQPVVGAVPAQDDLLLPAVNCQCRRESLQARSTESEPPLVNITAPHGAEAARRSARRSAGPVREPPERVVGSNFSSGSYAARAIRSRP